jgi:hypothetical protein
VSYSTAYAGLKAIVTTLRSSTLGDLRSVHDGIPTTPHALPMAFLEADNGTRTHDASGVVAIYRIRVSILVDTQGNDLAELAINPWINDVPIAIEAERGLGVGMDRAYVTDWQADHLTFGSGDGAKTTRRVYFTVEIKNRGARGTV